MRTNSMGRYIDEAGDEVRDRLLTAVDFNDGTIWYSQNGCGCLVGTGERGVSEKEAVKLGDSPPGRSRFAWETRTGRCIFDGTEWPEAPAAMRYPYAVRRFGKDRIVRAIKLRAGGKMPRIEQRIEEPEAKEIARAL